MIRASGAVRGTMRERRIARAGHRAAILRPLRSVSMVTLPLRCAVRAPDSGLQQKHGVLPQHPSIRRLREMIVSYFNLEDRNHNPLFGYAERGFDSCTITAQRGFVFVVCVLMIAVI